VTLYLFEPAASQRSPNRISYVCQPSPAEVNRIARTGNY